MTAHSPGVRPNPTSMMVMLTHLPNLTKANVINPMLATLSRLVSSKPAVTLVTPFTPPFHTLANNLLHYNTTEASLPPAKCQAGSPTFLPSSTAALPTPSMTHDNVPHLVQALILILIQEVLLLWKFRLIYFHTMQSLRLPIHSLLRHPILLVLTNLGSLPPPCNSLPFAFDVCCNPSALLRSTALLDHTVPTLRIPPKSTTDT